MMTILLERANYLEEHSIRPRSLKVTTISSLATEIVKGNADLSQLSAQGNYRAATAQDMGKSTLETSTSNSFLFQNSHKIGKRKRKCRISAHRPARVWGASKSREFF